MIDGDLSLGAFKLGDVATKIRQRDHQGFDRRPSGRRARPEATWSGSVEVTTSSVFLRDHHDPKLKH